MTFQEKIKSFGYSESDLTIDELKRLKDIGLIYEKDYYKYLMLKGKGD